MIRSFACPETARLFNDEPSRRLPTQIQRVAGVWMTSAPPPGNRFEALRGDRAGQHRIRVNGQWRVCFR